MPFASPWMILSASRKAMCACSGSPLVHKAAWICHCSSGKPSSTASTAGSCRTSRVCSLRPSHTARTEVDPLLGRTQTWKLSQWSCIKKDVQEKIDGINNLYQITSFVKCSSLFPVFHSQRGRGIQEKDASFFGCKTLQYSQTLLFFASSRV